MDGSGLPLGCKFTGGARGEGVGEGGPDPGPGAEGAANLGARAGRGVRLAGKRSRPARGSPAARGPATGVRRVRRARARGGGSGAGSPGGNRRGKLGSNPARAPFPRPLRGPSRRRRRAPRGGPPLRASRRDGNNLPAERSATSGDGAAAAAPLVPGGTRASRTPAPKPPRGAPWHPLPAGQSPPSPAPDAPRGLRSARPNTHLRDAAAGTYRGRSLAARRRAPLPIGPDSARGRAPREAAGPSGRRRRSCRPANGRPGGRAGLLLPRRRRRRPRPPRAPPALPRLQTPPPPARPQVPPPARAAVSHWPPLASPLGPALPLGAGAVRPAGSRAPGAAGARFPDPGAGASGGHLRGSGPARRRRCGLGDGAQPPWA